MENTSFLAPVVPLSPDNKSYNASRVYLGFFKPQTGGFWLGNLKKYGIDSTGAVLDKNGNPATDPDGSFLDTAISYWSTVPDGGEVDKGGVGEVLLNRDFNGNPRDIYTHLGAKAKLTRPKEAFTTSNNKLLPGMLGMSTVAEKDSLINFVHGRDAYDTDLDGNTTEKRGWILGDILHSRPQVVSYSSYTFSPTAEADCNVNKTLIFVGGNDGMLHVFKDCDGSEAWAFIPDELLVNLQYLTKATHTYFIDSSPSVYLYDKDKDGNIETVDGDKVIVIFGQRRGGGWYYALDVTDPAKPLYLFDLSSTYSPSGVNTEYAELGQSWSEPEITKVKVGTMAKVVAVIGAGYDNANEDGRYGATQTFNGNGTTSGNGEGVVTSSGTSAPLSPRGRGVYVVEVASLDSSGVPSFTNSGNKVWGHTNANNSALTFSIPSA
ncbi:MAG: PilC/PilY family type IV pilus protein, partial [Nitrospiria bacterium]